MALVTTKEMFRKAYDGGYAIGAFNFNSMETVQAIVGACQKANSPVILQVSQDVAENHTYYKKLVEAAVAESDIPIAWHLDHGSSFDLCKACIDGGYTSVMIDASSKPFEENIALTRRVVEYAHDHGVVVEAELGALAGVEDDVRVKDADARCTKSEEAAEFVRRTECDSLAIAMGTSHGAYKFKPGTDPRLRFDILQQIMALVPDFPLVLHGASGVPRQHIDTINRCGGAMADAIGIPDDQLRQAAQSGVCKINVASDLRITATAAIRQFMTEHPAEFDPRSYLKPARAAMEELVAHKLYHVLGSTEKA